jgi:Immunity protein 51
LRGRFEVDPEGDTFVVFGPDRQALNELADRMSAVATDAARLRHLLVAFAGETGFEFDG